MGGEVYHLCCRSELAREFFFFAPHKIREQARSYRDPSGFATMGLISVNSARAPLLENYCCTPAIA
jgi:hypothetical protein